MAPEPKLRRSAPSQKPRKNISSAKNCAKYIASQTRKSYQEREQLL